MSHLTELLEKHSPVYNNHQACEEIIECFGCTWEKGDGGTHAEHVAQVLEDEGFQVVRDEHHGVEEQRCSNPSQHSEHYWSVEAEDFMEFLCPGRGAHAFTMIEGGRASSVV